MIIAAKGAKLSMTKTQRPGSNPLYGTDWGRLLKAEFEQAYWTRLSEAIDDDRSRCHVYPPATQVFQAFELTWCEDTKVVILGQDPYHGPDQAHGLSFSVPCGVGAPRSLVNIHKELQSDLALSTDHGSLEPWAHRGVLLLNTTLTVRAHEPRSHMGWGWERFTDAVIRVVTEESDPVFLLWGEKALAKEPLITAITGPDSRIIRSSHPCPLSASRPCRGAPPFLGSKPFSGTNELLRVAGRDKIDWSLGP